MGRGGFRNLARLLKDVRAQQNLDGKPPQEEEAPQDAEAEPG